VVLTLPTEGCDLASESFVVLVVHRDTATCTGASGQKAVLASVCNVVLVGVNGGATVSFDLAVTPKCVCNDVHASTRTPTTADDSVAASITV
jgi:hypothetical protein